MYYFVATFFRWAHLVVEDFEMPVVLSSVMDVDFRYAREQFFIFNLLLLICSICWIIFCLQANSTREFSEHATQSQGSIGDVGGLKGECQTGFGGGDSKVEKQTVVDHMTKKFAGDPNDLRSRIVQRSGTTAEKGAGSAIWGQVH